MAKKIVVADDEYYISRSLSLLLRRDGFECEIAHDGEQAVRLVKEIHPAILFLDLDMPKKNGYEVLREVRRDPAYDDVRVILLTAKGTTGEEELGLQLGANLCLLKPFDPRQVVSLVRDIMAKVDVDEGCHS